MKIGLIFPNKDRRYKTIHLGLAYIAAYARENHADLDFTVLDTRVAKRQEVKRFFSSDFDLIGMTVFSPVYFEVIRIFNRIKETYPETPICLGGPYVTTMKELIFEETPADYAIYGEGEMGFSELIGHLKGDLAIEDIDGLIYKSETGEIHVNRPRKRMKSLDHLPSPAYDIFPMDRYPIHRIVTSRGCPYSCVWCNSSSIWKDGLSEMSPEKMVEEIEYLVKTHGKKIFVFGDNTFNTSIARSKRFCQILLDKELKISWSVSFRADKVDQELAFLMKKAGCFNVSIGIESANNSILKRIGKRTSIEEISKGIKILKQAGIEIMSQYVIGSPDETLETIRESIDYAKKSGCDYTNFYAILPYRGTEQWDYIRENGVFYSENIHDYHSMEPRIVFETPEFDQKQRQEAIKMVKKEGFYSNKDKKNWLFDFAKETSRKIQNLLPQSTGERVYSVLKSIYKLKIVKKNNL